MRLIAARSEVQIRCVFAGPVRRGFSRIAMGCRVFMGGSKVCLVGQDGSAPSRPAHVRSGPQYIEVGFNCARK